MWIARSPMAKTVAHRERETAAQRGERVGRLSCLDVSIYLSCLSLGDFPFLFRIMIWILSFLSIPCIPYIREHFDSEIITTTEHDFISCSQHVISTIASKSLRPKIET